MNAINAFFAFITTNYSIDYIELVDAVYFPMKINLKMKKVANTQSYLCPYCIGLCNVRSFVLQDRIQSS